MHRIRKLENNFQRMEFTIEKCIYWYRRVKNPTHVGNVRYFLIFMTNFDAWFFLLKSLKHFESISPRRVSRFCFQLDLMLIAVWSYQKFKSRPVFRIQQTVILEHIDEFCFRWLDNTGLSQSWGRKFLKIFNLLKWKTYERKVFEFDEPCLKCINCLFNFDVPAFLCNFQTLFFAFSLGLATLERSAIAIELHWSHKCDHI